MSRCVILPRINEITVHRCHEIKKKSATVPTYLLTATGRTGIFLGCTLFYTRLQQPLYTVANWPPRHYDWTPQAIIPTQWLWWGGLSPQQSSRLKQVEEKRMRNLFFTWPPSLMGAWELTFDSWAAHGRLPVSSSWSGGERPGDHPSHLLSLAGNDNYPIHREP